MAAPKPKRIIIEGEGGGVTYNPEHGPGKKSIGRQSRRKPKVKVHTVNWDTQAMRTVALKVTYLGWDYIGLAAQKNSAETVEMYVFDALKRAQLVKELKFAEYTRCGRTDKGVSASSQVLSFKMRSKSTPEKPISIQNDLNYARMINSFLPKDIRVVAVAEVPADFSARFDCLHRTYRYYFSGEKLNLAAMKEGAAHLRGRHDFRNFAKMDAQNISNYERVVLHTDIHRVGSDEMDGTPLPAPSPLSGSPNSPDSSSMFYFQITGYAFLWHQVRNMMSVLFMVGRGVENPRVVADMLDLSVTPRKPQYTMASEKGLQLFDCGFENLPWHVDIPEHIRTIRSMREEADMLLVKAALLKDHARYVERMSVPTHNLRNYVSGVKKRVDGSLCKRIAASNRAATERIEEIKKLGKMPPKDDKKARLKVIRELVASQPSAEDPAWETVPAYEPFIRTVKKVENLDKVLDIDAFHVPLVQRPTEFTYEERVAKLLAQGKEVRSHRPVTVTGKSE